MNNYNAINCVHDDGSSESLLKRLLLLESVIDNLPVGLVVFDSNLKMILCNKNQQRMLDYPQDFLSDGPPTLEDVFWYNANRGEYGPGNAEEHVAARMQLVKKKVEHVYERTRPNGTVLEVRGVPLPGGGFATIYADVTDHRANQKAVAFLATHDAVTGLPNRAAFERELQGVASDKAEGNATGIVFIDLDGFKPVNDIHGHATGDELLRLVAVRLRRSVREQDFVCRLGGDEFVAIVRGISNSDEFAKVVDRMQECFTSPFVIGQNQIHIGASIGVSLYPRDSRDPHELLHIADQAMYKAKSTNKRLARQERRKPLRQQVA